jgi:c(7)-type cytochrome triheme protein
MKKMSFLFLCVLVCAGIAAAQSQSGMKKRRPLPYEYGKVVINNYSEKAGFASVVFDHWVHRSKFTCRLCHVDIAFAMKGGGTNIRAADNMNGYYCGACHNGKLIIDKTAVFEACAKKLGGENGRRCERCHSQGKNVKPERDFMEFASRLPKERFGNGLNWEKAEADGYIKPLDFLESVSIRKPALAVPKEMFFEPKGAEMPDIIFSHKKHTVWNGCELCHPEIFVSVKKGSRKYSMEEIFEGKYCGVCHNAVAFPLLDCQRCHSKQV